MKNKNLKKFLGSFLFLAIGLGIAAALILQFVWFLNRDNLYPATLCVSLGFRGYCFLEFDNQPLPYLLSLVLVSALIGALWSVFWVSRHRKRLAAQILLVPWISLLAVSPIFGLIYSTHLRSPQYFEEHYNNSRAVMWLFYRTDAWDGLRWEWLTAVQSFPVNILSYIAFCLLLFANIKLISNKGFVRK